MGFSEVPLRVMKALGVRSSGGPTTQVVGVDKWEVVTQEMESDSSTGVCQSFRKRSDLFFEHGASDSLRGKKQERLGSDQGIGPADKNYQRMKLLPTAPAAMVDVKEEDVFVEKLDGSDIELTCTANESFECGSEL